MMKKFILVLTDLSSNALKAVETATVLSRQLHADLLLFNCNDTISAVTYYPIVPILSEFPTWFEERKEQLRLLSAHMKQFFAKAYPGHRLPVIKTLIKEGELYSNVKDVMKEFAVELVVMGAKTGSSTEDFLFGSDTINIADHITVPLLVVPASVKFTHIKRITFATNFLEQDVESLNFLFKISKLLGAQLDIVHIRQYGKAEPEKNTKIMDLISEKVKSKSPLVIYNEVYGKRVVSRLDHYCKENDSDIMAFSHEHHSFLFRTLNQGTVKESLFNQHMSILIIPEIVLKKKTPDKSLHKLSGIVF